MATNMSIQCNKQAKIKKKKARYVSRSIILSGWYAIVCRSWPRDRQLSLYKINAVSARVGVAEGGGRLWVHGEAMVWWPIRVSPSFNPLSSSSFSYSLSLVYFPNSVSLLIYAHSIARPLIPSTILFTTHCALCGLVTYFHNWRSSLMDLAVRLGLPVRPGRIISGAGRRVAVRIVTSPDVHRSRQALTVAIVT
jgi:hypothetical protein